MSKVNNYLSLVKFSHTIFAMPFAVIGFFIATQREEIAFDRTKFALVIACMIFARSAAMAFNRYIDRKFDEANKRTAVREIPSGIITPQNALAFVIINSILFCTATFFINQICLFLSPVALLVILGYSYTKRFTALCHLVLGVGLSLAPIGAYLAVTGKFDPLPIMYSFTVLFWVSGFDIIYALQDDEFDKSQKLHSIPVAMGRRGALILSTIFHFIAALLVVYAGMYAGFGKWYWLGCMLFIGLLIYQHMLVKPNDLSKVNIAFMTTNGIASVIFSGFVLLELFLK